MKTFCALLSAIIFAILSVNGIYFIMELWGNISLLTSTTIDILTVALIIVFEYCLISGFFVSLLAFKKKGFHNLKDTFEDGLINKLVFGLIGGLISGLIFGLIFGISIGWFNNSLAVLFDGLVSGLFAGLITALFYGFILGLIVGIISEQKPQVQK